LKIFKDNSSGYEDEDSTSFLSTSSSLSRSSAASGQSEKIPLSAWKTLGILSCIATMVMYAETMLIPAIPDLISHFHVSYTMSSWVLTAYLVSGAVMTPIAGKLSDIYGKKKILLIVMLIYAVGVSIAGLAPTFELMLLARAVQGIGMSMFPIAFSIVRDQFPRVKISIGQGVITSMFASGAIIGLIVGGFIIQNYGWQATFFTIIPVAFALLFVIRKYIIIGSDIESSSEVSIASQDTVIVNPEIMNEERKMKDSTSAGTNIVDESRRIDILGAVTLAIAIISLLLSITLFETSAGNGSLGTNVDENTIVAPLGLSSEIWLTTLVVVGVVSSVVFVIVERRAKNPLVDFRLLFDKVVLPANLMILIVGLSMFMVFETIPILVRNPIPLGFGESALGVGNVQLPFAIVLLIFGPTSGFIISKLGSIKPIIAGSVITSAGFFALWLVHSNPICVSAGLAVLSVGLSLTSVGAMNIVILATPPKYSGISLGMTSLLRIVGSSVGPVVAAVYLQTIQSRISIGSGIFGSFPSQESFGLVFLTAAIASLVSVGLALSLRSILSKIHIPNLS
jgi:MFS family permease